MRGASTLIPARFIALIAHLCVAISLLWETELSSKICSSSRHSSNLQQYQSKLLGGFAASVALILLELSTFMLGLTMFSASISLLSIGCHGGASIILTYFILDGWLCEWYWPIFAICSVLPSICDTSTALCTTEQKLLQPQPAYKESWSLYLILAGLATTLGSSVPVGYNIGVVNTPAEIIKQFCNESISSRYNVVLDAGGMNILWSSIVSIFIIGGCTGSLLGANLANSLGRKKATILTNILSIAGAVCFYFARPANSVEMLLLGRLLVGLSAGLTTSIVPMYLTELAGVGQAGAAGVLCPMGVNFGVLVGQLMGLPFLLGGVDDWPLLLAAFALLVIVCLPIICILPESPKYLYVVKGFEEKASDELSRLRGVSRSLLTRELDTLQEERIATLRTSEGWGLRQVAMDPRLRLPLLLAASGQLGQQTSGINAVFYYSSRIFQQAGLSKTNAQYATIGCGFINVCTCVIMVWLLPLKGRRPLLLSSTLSAATLLLFLGISMLFMNAASWMPYVCMMALLAYVLVYGFGLGPIPYFIASELFEVGPRPGGMALASLANWGGNFLVGMTFPTLNNLIGPYCFLIFAAITGALYVFLRIYFPETKNKTPAQVAKLCSRGFKSKPLRSDQTDSV